MAGSDPSDPTTTDIPYKYQIETVHEFKLAVLKGATDGVNEDVAHNFEKALRVLENFSTIEEIEFPDLPYEAITRTILRAEAASAFDEFTESGRARELTAPADQYGPYARTVVLAKDYLKALRLRRVMAEAVDEAMVPYDAVVAPSRRGPASPIDEEFRRVSPGAFRDVMGSVGNGAGLPSISVPSGFTKSGLPTGIQFMGRPYTENVIIAAARTYQSKTDWHLEHPEGLASDF
jgi:aspartyl-tRNA(Asn)/glutamyl-tRNA(Gln) amidotransferase subunit A